jgi:hypothetical protein
MEFYWILVPLLGCCRNKVARGLAALGVVSSDLQHFFLTFDCAPLVLNKISMWSREVSCW